MWKLIQATRNKRLPVQSKIYVNTNYWMNDTRLTEPMPLILGPTKSLHCKTNDYAVISVQRKKHFCVASADLYYCVPELAKKEGSFIPLLAKPNVAVLLADRSWE
jgi:hypothetical protein